MKGALMIAVDKVNAGKASPERAYAREAYSAIKDGDEEGFVSAFLGAVRACASKAGAKDEGEDSYEEG